MLPEIIQRQNVGMIERGRSLRLLLKAPHAIRIAGETGRQNLDRYVTVETRVARTIDLTHASGSGRCQDLIGSKFGAGGECHEWG